ncbi:Protein cornichon homolog 4 [Linum perenne]
MGDLYVWLISFFFVIALIFIVIFQLMCLADLESDYINPYDSSSRINKAILPDYMRRQHLIDVTEVFNLLRGEMNQRIYKLVYLILLLFLAIFWMIMTALEDSDMD